jgi:hypothetical protein
MPNSSIIHPGPGHVSIFRIDGTRPGYTTLRRDRDKEEDGDKDKKNNDKKKDSDKTDDKKPIEGRGDEDWWRRVPGIIAPRGDPLVREFDNLGAVRGALAEIRATAAAVAPARDLLLITRHRGPLDASHVFALCDDLKRGGVDATIVIDHQDQADP